MYELGINQQNLMGQICAENALQVRQFVILKPLNLKKFRHLEEMSFCSSSFLVQLETLREHHRLENYLFRSCA